MKKNIHPENYRLVVFKDTSCDYSFLTKSTIETKETVVWDDGNEYPLYNIYISNNSDSGLFSVSLEFLLPIFSLCL